LQKWKEGKLSLGELRRSLESDVWPHYGTGLWTESWAAFFGSLARAVQPYAHYSPDLLGWQIKLAHYDGNRRARFIADLAPQGLDPIKSDRIALLQAVITWTFSRLLLANRPEVATCLSADADQMQAALRDSKLLFAEKDWPTQLMPHFLFRPDADWIDE